VKSVCRSLSVVPLFALCFSLAHAQVNPQFDINAYREFLASHRDLTYEQLNRLHSSGLFTAGARTDFQSAAYFDSIDAKYRLTTYEKSLVGKHGFVVTERLQPATFGHAFQEIYNCDLPVFISTDAILHALHMSYDEILMQVERSVLSAKLDSLLAALHNALPALAAKYDSIPAMKPMLNDIDVYLTVPRSLLNAGAAPKFPENAAVVGQLLGFIRNQQPVKYPLFSGTERDIDFSQFTPRGHYTREPELTWYFQAMMWLGRTEIYLIAPEGVPPPRQTDQDIQRQTIDAVLINEAAELSGALRIIGEMENILRFFVGEPDNVTLENVRSLVQETHLQSARELLDVQRWKDLQQTLKQQSYAFQRINSQILYSDPMDPDGIKPASSFLLIGQRFIVDSYVTGSVVFDKIVYQGDKVRRMLPATLDVLFALGNDAAGQFLRTELDQYHYASNLAALRYLIDSYDQSFWQASLYNEWLNAIRTLDPPGDRAGLPAFMQTAAWWQEKMNTQLASWGQLRHDNLLYGKQSYSGGVICSFPESYVEPIPQFYDAVRQFAESGAAAFQQPFLHDDWIRSYFVMMRGIADTLAAVARKELSGTLLSAEEKGFLHGMLHYGYGCGDMFSGWYPHLYFTGETGVKQVDMVVADVHTAPTDALGSPVGWVLHGGTGPLNFEFVVTELPDGRLTAFVGPVLSYYEHLSTNFKRLTDEEWKTMYAVEPSFRPSFVNLYLADSKGGSRPDGPSLLAGVSDNEMKPLPSALLLGQNFPNPFNPSTVIPFTIPAGLAHARVELTVYDVIGRSVKRLLSGDLPEGHYLTRWDGTDESGVVVPSGVYFYHLAAGNQRAVGKMSLLK